MPNYVLDSNIFIQAKNGPYDMAVFPSFWDWLLQEMQGSNLISSSFVYDEIRDGKDSLAEWFARIHDSSIFQSPSDNSQKIFQNISDFVIHNYELAFADEFLGKADPWVIAQAKDLNCIVVTNEVLVNSQCKKVKVPNICVEFSVSYINLYELLRESDVRF